MASVQTNSYQGRYLKLTVVEESYSIKDNTSTIRWTLESIGGQSNYYTIYNWGVWVNGQEIYGKQTTNWDTRTFPASKGSVTGTITVGHNADGSAPAIGFTLKGKVYYGGEETFNGSCNLTTIPRQANITSAPDFNDESNPTIRYSNPAGNAVSSLEACISLTGSTDDIAYRAISKTGDSYTFNLTQEERNTLINACLTSKTRTVKFYIKTIIGGNIFYSISEKTLTIVNANPTFSANNLSYQDNNQTTVAITQDSSKIVRNNSHLLVSFTGATPKKGATIVDYQLKFNGYTESGNSPFSKNFGIVNLTENTKFQVIVTDSRGYTTTAEKTISIYDWVNPVGQIAIGRINNYEDQTNIKVKTEISSVGNKNAIKSIKYRYKKTTDATYSADVSIQDNVLYTFVIDKNYAWNVQIEITDKFGTTTYNMIIPKGKPILFIDINKLSVGVNCFPVGNNTLELNGTEVLEYDVVDQW